MKILFTTLSALLLAGGAFAFQDAKVKEVKQVQKGDDAAIIAKQLPSYPTNKCVVSDEPLDAMGDPVNMVVEGRLVRLCCKGCVKALKKDPDTVIGSIDKLVVKAQAESYPLTTCPVSGEELGSQGDPIEMVHGTRLVRLCCKGCVKGFKKDPSATMAKIDAALIAQQLKSYPLSTCLVSGMEIEGEGKNVLYGVQLTRFCCDKCPEAFAKNPQKYLPKLSKAKKGVKEGEKGL